MTSLSSSLLLTGFIIVIDLPGSAVLLYSVQGSFFSSSPDFRAEVSFEHSQVPISDTALAGEQDPSTRREWEFPGWAQGTSGWFCRANRQLDGARAQPALHGSYPQGLGHCFGLVLPGQL